jgi:hypothetical protein
MRIVYVFAGARYIDRGATEAARAAISRLRRHRKASVMHGWMKLANGLTSGFSDRSSRR